MRLLFVLVHGSRPLETAEEKAVAVFQGEKRLNALEFWMRNPDYLAEELLNLYEKTKVTSFYHEAFAIMSDDEPDLRRLPMIRFLFGAYERVDNSLAILRSRELIRITGRKASEKILEVDYLVMKEAVELTERIPSQYPLLKWYSDRARLVAQVAGDATGTALKERQYNQIEYAKTVLGGTIPPIAERVWDRLRSMDYLRTSA